VVSKNVLLIAPSFVHYLSNLLRAVTVCITMQLVNCLAEGDKGRDTLDAILSQSYCRSQTHLSRQLSLLHPELTMPMFSGNPLPFL